MAIHESTRIQAYQLKKGGTLARLSILKMIAADSKNNRNPHTHLRMGDWKGARHYTLASYDAAFCLGLYSSFTKGGQSWYSHGGEQFRGERHADEILNLRHNGWFTDTDCDETARGIVGRLTHGRFIAGYVWSSNDERVYFGKVFDCEREAARYADSCAESFAEDAREDSERFRAMSDAESAADDARKDFTYAWKARHVSGEHRETAREALETLRAAIADCAEKTAEYERG